MSLDPSSPFVAPDPTTAFIGASCLDFLLIELVPLAHRITNHLDNAPVPIPTPASATSTGTSVAGPGTRRLDDDEERDATHRRLEALGYRVGQGLVERFSRDRPRLTDSMDVIKFLCKDVWSIAFGKQVDNLKTNHRGVYVLTDLTFRPLMRMSTDAGGQAVVRAKPFLSFPAGIVKGALAALGLVATVLAETTELPIATFHIKTVPAMT